MSRNPKRSNTPVIVLLILLIVIMIAATGLVIWLCIDLVNKETVSGSTPSTSVSLPVRETEPEETETEPPETTLPEPEHVVSTATIGSMGDLLMHIPVVNTALQSDGSYNFDSVFKYIKEYSEAVDYAAVNLETTLYGTGKAYSGFPMFNSPDAIVDGAKNAGFDLMLTANNHSYDTGITGYTRTLEVCRDAGFDTLGTMASADEPKYRIKEINGINIGMICYTYETSDGSGAYPSLNGNPMYDGSYDIINCFRSGNPEPFYQEIEGYLKEMKEAGAEATMVYIHWGVEYQTYANDAQKAIAQKLCDLGVDVIVGGHPHVVQPVDLLESTVDPDHKTVIIYSLGNAVSNQRKEFMTNYNPNGYTEDGVMFTVTFEKYSDGTVYLSGADVLPTWVNMDTRSVKEYNILPLDYAHYDEWQTIFDLNDSMLNSAKKSYDRTQSIVSEGLTECQTWLAEQKQAREQYYYDLVYNPDKAVTETVTEETTIATEAA